jgi:hypothetical protein
MPVLMQLLHQYGIGSSSGSSSLITLMMFVSFLSAFGSFLAPSHAIAMGQVVTDNSSVNIRMEVQPGGEVQFEDSILWHAISEAIQNFKFKSLFNFIMPLMGPRMTN